MGTKSQRHCHDLLMWNSSDITYLVTAKYHGRRTMRFEIDETCIAHMAPALSPALAVCPAAMTFALS